MNLPLPVDVSEVCGLLGMANCVAHIMPNISDSTAPIRSFSNKNSTQISGHSQGEAFARTKLQLSYETCMAKYHPHYRAIALVDTSSRGLGAVLLHDQPSAIRRTVTYSSRSLTLIKRHYSQTEKGSLAVTWAVSTFDLFSESKLRVRYGSSSSCSCPCKQRLGKFATSSTANTDQADVLSVHSEVCTWKNFYLQPAFYQEHPAMHQP